jgi:hypothetical protein
VPETLEELGRLPAKEILASLVLSEPLEGGSGLRARAWRKLGARDFKAAAVGGNSQRGNERL